MLDAIALWTGLATDSQPCQWLTAAISFIFIFFVFYSFGRAIRSF